jgi:AraC-like DNA-binding protein
LGGEPANFLAQVGIDAAETARGGFQASYRQTAELLELTAAELGCPDLGMKLASRQCSVPTFGPLGEAVRHARSFGEALQVITQHSYAHSLAAGIRVQQANSGRGVTLCHDILVEGLSTKQQLVEFVLLTHQLWAIRLTGGLVRGRRIHIRHHPVSPLRTYRRYFGCEVRFGASVNGLVYYDRDLDRPTVAADQQALQSALTKIVAQFPQHEPPLSVLTRGAILHVLGTSLCTTETIARALNLHPRTLHRRLREEGASFRKILDEVRRDSLDYYLRHTSLELSDISERLGFSEQSVLTRFCRRWFAQTPSHVRSRSQGSVTQR